MPRRAPADRPDDAATRGVAGEEPAAAAAARMGSPVLEELRRVLALAEQVRPAVAARAGLSTSELVALEHLVAGPLGPVEIARRLRLTSAASSAIVDRLQGRGHVVREPDPRDGRRTRVVLTGSGRAEVLGHLVPMFEGLAAAEAQLSDERDRRAVLDFLRAVGEALRAAT